MPEFPVLSPALQLGFYQRLKEAERAHLLPALLRQIGRLTIGLLDQELLKFAGSDRLSFMARRGLRGELVFPVPYLLSSMPTLLGTIDCCWVSLRKNSTGDHLGDSKGWRTMVF